MISPLPGGLEGLIDLFAALPTRVLGINIVGIVALSTFFIH